MAARVFISYAHEDESLRQQLDKHLSMLKRQGLVEVWHDRRLNVGDHLDERIEEELNGADVILLLVSPDFLASNYCYKIEKTRALERHREGTARLVSVILRPCDWLHTDLSQYLVTPKDGRPITRWPDLDEAFLDVTQAIRRAIEEIGKVGIPLQTRKHIEQPSPTQEGTNLPRSSNLRLRKNFTEADKDRFRDDAFDYMAKFFEGSLNELQARNPGVDTRFRRVDGNKFTAAIYSNGQKAASCTIRIGGHFEGGICFADGDDASDNSFNEQLNVDNDDQALFLEPLGMRAMQHNDGDDKLTMEGASEFYWSLLIGPLQGGDL